MTSPLAEGFVRAAALAGDLATSDDVAARWDDESSCAGMTVGGLAHHLMAQVGNVVRFLRAAPGPEAPIPLLEHYRRARWVRSDLDDDANVAIREAADREAAVGAAALAAQVRTDLAELPGVLAAPRQGGVLIPWQGWSLSVEDFLVTRSMEVVVHSDDLAASVGLPTPEFPEAVVHPVLALLAAVAADRHGQTAVVRALSRPQRAPQSVSAF